VRSLSRRSGLPAAKRQHRGQEPAPTIAKLGHYQYFQAPSGHMWCSPVPSRWTMTATGQFLGALTVAILVPTATWGQGGSITNSPFPLVPVPPALSVTNPPAALPLNVPQPSLPQITVPQPAQVNIPLATEPPPASSMPLSPLPPMPLLVPSTQELVTKSLASAPGGSQTRLSAIAASSPTLSLTNTGTATTGASGAPLTNSSAQPSSVWDKNTPLLNGVDYHW
jgi:hypothetical protein